MHTHLNLKHILRRIIFGLEFESRKTIDFDLRGDGRGLKIGEISLKKLIFRKCKYLIISLGMKRGIRISYNFVSYK